MGENERSQRLTPAQQRALTALLAERDIRSAAFVAKVPEGTLRRWLSKNAAFREALREAQAAVFSESTRLLARLQTSAVVTLANTMLNPAAQDGARVSAAKAILDAGERRVAAADTEARLDALEAILEESGEL